MNDVAALFTGGSFCLFLLVPLIFRTLRVGGPQGSAFKGLSFLLKPTPVVISSGLVALVPIYALMSPRVFLPLKCRAVHLAASLGLHLAVQQTFQTEQVPNAISDFLFNPSVVVPASENDDAVLSYPHTKPDESFHAVPPPLLPAS